MTDTVLSLPAGRVVSNIQTVALGNNTPHTQESAAVPAGRRWLLRNIIMQNGDSVTRVLRCLILDGAGGNVIGIAINSYSTLTGYYIGTCIGQTILTAGMCLQFNWAAGGASAGGNAVYGLIADEVPA